MTKGVVSNVYPVEGNNKQVTGEEIVKELVQTFPRPYTVDEMWWDLFLGVLTGVLTIGMLLYLISGWW